MTLLLLLNQSISFYGRANYDAYGKEVFGSATTYKARVQEVTKSRLLPSGQTVTIDAICYMEGDLTVAANDRVDYSGRRYKVHGFSKAVDGQGNVHHTKLELIKWV